MARPRKAPEALRDDLLGVRLTTAERAELDRLAALHGLTAAEFMRRRAFGYRMPANVALAHTRAAEATALMRIGVNLNQLTRAANAGRLLPNSIEELAGRIAAILDRLYDRGPDERRPQL